jgi:hypothetical protein
MNVVVTVRMPVVVMYEVAAIGANPPRAVDRPHHRAAIDRRVIRVWIAGVDPRPDEHMAMEAAMTEAVEAAAVEMGVAEAMSPEMTAEARLCWLDWRNHQCEAERGYRADPPSCQSHGFPSRCSVALVSTSDGGAIAASAGDAGDAGANDAGATDASGLP